MRISRSLKSATVVVIVGLTQSACRSEDRSIPDASLPSTSQISEAAPSIEGIPVADQVDPLVLEEHGAHTPLILEFAGKTRDQAIAWAASKGYFETILLSRKRREMEDARHAYYQKHWGENVIFRRQNMTFLPPGEGDLERPFRSIPLVLVFEEDSLYEFLRAVQRFDCWRLDDHTAEAELDLIENVRVNRLPVAHLGFGPKAEYQVNGIIDHWIRSELALLEARFHRWVLGEDFRLHLALTQNRDLFPLSADEKKRIEEQLEREHSHAIEMMRNQLMPRALELLAWDTQIEKETAEELFHLIEEMVAADKRLSRLARSDYRGESASAETIHHRPSFSPTR